MNDVNFDKLMIDQVGRLDHKPRLLLHACCAPCATAVIERLRPHFDITVYFYNPNIQPEDEYLRRESELKRLLSMEGYEGIGYIEGEYDEDRYSSLTEHMSEDREGGARCVVCHDMRLERTAQVARDGGYEYFATTLSVSPHKNPTLINSIGEKLSQTYGVEWLYADFKKRGGYQRSVQLSNELGIYRQSYCGCLYTRDR